MPQPRHPSSTLTLSPLAGEGGGEGTPTPHHPIPPESHAPSSKAQPPTRRAHPTHPPTRTSPVHPERQDELAVKDAAPGGAGRASTVRALNPTSEASAQRLAPSGGQGVVGVQPPPQKQPPSHREGGRGMGAAARPPTAAPNHHEPHASGTKPRPETRQAHPHNAIFEVRPHLRGERTAPRPGEDTCVAGCSPHRKPHTPTFEVLPHLRSERAAPRPQRGTGMVGVQPPPQNNPLPTGKGAGGWARPPGRLRTYRITPNPTPGEPKRDASTSPHPGVRSPSTPPRRARSASPPAGAQAWWGCNPHHKTTPFPPGRGQGDGRGRQAAYDSIELPRTPRPANQKENHYTAT